jgi:hypothetical protein
MEYMVHQGRRQSAAEAHHKPQPMLPWAGAHRVEVPPRRQATLEYSFSSAAFCQHRLRDQLLIPDDTHDLPVSNRNTGNFSHKDTARNIPF